MKNFINIEDCSNITIKSLIDQSLYWKKQASNPTHSKPLNNKIIGLIFEKPSTRTRVSFEVAITKLGGTALFMNNKDLQLSRNESIKDTAKVLGSYLDGIVIRTHKHEQIEEFLTYSNIPVINGLSEKEHPCQIIADLATIKEVCGTLSGQKIIFVGRFNNVSRSLMLGCLKMGMTFGFLGPHADWPNDETIIQAKKIAKDNNGIFLVNEDPKENLEGCNFIYTDVWKSMGEEDDIDIEKMKNYQLNDNLLKYAEKDVKIMHCLPANKNEEITENVFELHSKTIFQQAENRLYAHMAILESIFT